MSTGHATHFLERLSRMSPAETELALSLYRDSRLVGLLLHYVDPPAEIERIAISVAKDDEGPFIVVDRSGAFVTCLGRRMGTDGLHVVSHDRFLHYRSRSEELARRADEARALAGPGGAEALLHRLTSKEHVLSREEFRAATVLQPVFKTDFLRLLAETLITYDAQLRALGRLNSVSRKSERRLHALWSTYQLIGHLVLLALMDGRARLDDDAMADLFPILFYVYDLGTIHSASRALWALGRVGKPMLPLCKAAAAEPESGAMLVFALSGLATLALRHRRLREEATKAMRTAAQRFGDLSEGIKAQLRDLGTERLVQLARVVDEPDAQSAPILEHVRVVAHESLSGLDVPPEHTYGSPAEIPLDIAVAWGLSFPGDLRSNAMLGQWLASLIPYLASAEADRFYLPASLLEGLDWSWHPELSMHLLRSDRQSNPARKPAERDAGRVGRNAPCPCGSGRKYKRCHGGG